MFGCVCFVPWFDWLFVVCWLIGIVVRLLSLFARFIDCPYCLCVRVFVEYVRACVCSCFGLVCLFVCLFVVVGCSRRHVCFA